MKIWASSEEHDQGKLDMDGKGLQIDSELRTIKEMKSVRLSDLQKLSASALVRDHKQEAKYSDGNGEMSMTNQVILHAQLNLAFNIINKVEQIGEKGAEEDFLKDIVRNISMALTGSDVSFCKTSSSKVGPNDIFNIIKGNQSSEDDNFFFDFSS